jgi:hypothetical protein
LSIHGTSNRAVAKADGVALHKIVKVKSKFKASEARSDPICAGSISDIDLASPLRFDRRWYPREVGALGRTA